MNGKEDILWLPAGNNGLACCSNAASAWFCQRQGTPTPIQEMAWPAIAAGRNVLISAPTGSGKTLAAFLPLLAPPQHMVPRWNQGTIRGLYIAPLRALTNDVRRNLNTMLEELIVGLPEGILVPRLGVRSGDTSPGERRVQRRHPPDVLLTTPESLAILLSQATEHRQFQQLRWVILDEIHVLAASKRGADLSLSLERLEQLTGTGLQRIGLSATARPLEQTARYLAGVGRPCDIAAVGDPSPLELVVTPLTGMGSFLGELVERIVPVLQVEPGTLIFTNTRNLAERLAWALRRRQPDWDEEIAVHHSALATNRRLEVEARFKAGQLRCVVSSTSLELGIDIGPVQRVILVHPPGDVIRLLQRLGRAGHGPGRIRRGLVLTASAAELLEAAVTARSGQQEQCEPLRIPENPLDVLCQQIVGMGMTGPCVGEEVYALVRRAYPYRDLPRQEFDDCLDYLLGKDRFGEDWVPARLQGFRHHFRMRDGRMARLLRRNLGTLLTEEAAAVHLLSDDAEEPPLVIGQVDNLYAERLQPGDRFLLDGRCLEFRRIQEGIVLVQQTAGRPGVPRWGGTGWPLSAELAQRLFALRLQAAEALREGPEALARLLDDDLGLGSTGVELLAGYFQQQDCLSEIPDPGVLLIEVVAQAGRLEYHLHTPLNRLANDGLARVLVRRLARDFGRTCQPLVADLGLGLVVRGNPLAADAMLPDLFRTLLAATDFEQDLNAALTDSEAFRQRFQQVATTGLMLLRNPLGRRRKVGGTAWAEQHLFDQVQAHDTEFVLLRQAAREIRAAWCDVVTAKAYADQLPNFAVRCRWLGQPSPFARHWTQEEPGETESLESPAAALQRLHALLLGDPGGESHAG